MYIDYSKLWKLLIDKSLSKSDLMQLTGISSRVLAKLSKNETVTTDTVARICAALHCNVGDIMECVEEQQLSLYALYRKHCKDAERGEMYDTVRFTVNDRAYVVYATKKAATKYVHIHCKGGTVYWERFYPNTGPVASPISEITAWIRPECKKDETAIVLIKGKPGIITGLDEDIFVSAHGQKKKPSDVFVMSEAAFKIFEIEK